MKNKMLSKSPRRFIRRALAKAATWEVRGQKHLAAGEWPQAIHAFEAKLQWVTRADEIRHHGILWPAMHNPAKQKWWAQF